MVNDGMARKRPPFHADIGLLPSLCAIAGNAGALIMGIYNEAAANDQVLGTTIKADNSPVTRADHLSSAYIEKALRALTPGIPVVCEENETAPGPDGTYWAVDPLDGTKEFIGRTGGFAVKIGLLRDNMPVLSAVCAPAQDTLYYTATGLPAFKQVAGGPPAILRTRTAPRGGALTTLFNLTHADPALYDRERAALLARGLAVAAAPDPVPNLPRSLRVAEGLADVVVVTGKDETLQGSGGYVWDNTDWLIVKNAGGAMIRLTDRQPLRFDTGRERMPAYITIGDKKLARKAFPELH